jgi:hypothetical protein
MPWRVGACKGRRGITPRILNLDTKRKRVVSYAPHPLYRLEMNPGAYWIWGWVSFTVSFWTILEKREVSASAGIRTPCRTAYGESQWRLEDFRNVESVREVPGFELGPGLDSLTRSSVGLINISVLTSRPAITKIFLFLQLNGCLTSQISHSKFP